MTKYLIALCLLPLCLCGQVVTQPPASSAAPSGSAGGVLSGSYPNPGFASSVTLPGTPALGTPPAYTDNSKKLADTNFVRVLLAALNPATAVAAATVTVLPNSPTYSANVLTAGSNGALIVDGYTVLLNDRVLVNNQAAGLQNGVYTETTLGTAGVAYVLTRASDFNTAAAINAAGVIPVTNGTVNNGTTWALDAAITTLGTDSILYDQTNPQPPAIVTVNGAACTIGSSCNANYKTGAITTLHVAQFNGTAGQIQDGGAMPVSPTTNQNLRTIGAVLTPSALTACVYVPFAGTIGAFHAIVGDGGVAGTVLVKVETQPTFATFISTGVGGASDISNGGEQLTAVKGLVDTTLTSWTTTIAAGTTVCFVASTFSAGVSLNANVNVAAN